MSKNTPILPGVTRDELSVVDDAGKFAVKVDGRVWASFESRRAAVGWVEQHPKMLRITRR